MFLCSEANKFALSAWLEFEGVKRERPKREMLGKRCVCDASSFVRPIWWCLRVVGVGEDVGVGTSVGMPVGVPVGMSLGVPVDVGVPVGVPVGMPVKRGQR